MTGPVEPPMAAGAMAKALDALGQSVPCGYSHGQAPATEPTALATLALAAHRRREAGRGLAWLAASQQPDGHLPVRNGDGPGWGTALGVLAAARGQAAGKAAPSGRSFDVGLAIAWILSIRGEIQPNGPIYGHDTTIVGWPWASPSHSWIEPTAMNVLALKAAGRGGDPRSREAIRLLVDRLLPAGGCNYGNVTVLGRSLRPQASTTGLALLALAGEEDPEGRISLALDYLDAQLSPVTTAISLAYGLMALAAWGRPRRDAGSLILAALDRARGSKLSGSMGTALICLAAAPSNPLLFPAEPANSRTGGHADG